MLANIIGNFLVNITDKLYWLLIKKKRFLQDDL